MMRKRFFSLFVFGLIFGMAACSEQELTAPSNEKSEEIQLEFSEVSPEFSSLQRRGRGRNAVTVMTRNIYVGTDVGIVLSAQTPQEIPIKAAEAFQLLQSTNFPERAKSLAREIALTRPHLIGLQEVATFRIQSPGDAVVGGTIPAEDVLYNYLEILLNELSLFGLDYQVAGIVQNIDIEVPMLVNTNPLQFDDIRLTDHDVVLARSDIEISDVVTANYSAQLTVPGIGVVIPRGFVAVDAKVKRQSYRFVNTHLEPAFQPVQLAQAQELLQFLQNETLPVIMAGDFNTQAPTGETYQFIESQNYEDVWTRNILPFNPNGYTSNHDADLRNETVNFFQRIDLIFVRGNVLDPVLAIVVGDEQWNRTPSGLWPSDHGGVIARLPFSNSQNLVNISE